MGLAAVWNRRVATTIKICLGGVLICAVEDIAANKNDLGATREMQLLQTKKKIYFAKGARESTQGADLRSMAQHIWECSECKETNHQFNSRCGLSSSSSIDFVNSSVGFILLSPIHFHSLYGDKKIIPKLYILIRLTSHNLWISWKWNSLLNKIRIHRKQK